MSEVNKLDNKKCPFDPNQYQVNDDNINVPAGIFAWAVSLVNLGKLVRRDSWNSNIKYIKLLPGNNREDILPQIEIIDNYGATSWQPTQEDMMACDWVLVKGGKAS
ncbi:DUF2829 domain-containing protein [Xenorhabdus sp. 12]|uniref:DUF2829 domain-containing protein n=1 Tax=Xenorhabdus santafensis TaxID=2582833 RepID=A0ABU4SEP1_9GAMM|nr:MW1434 family type I TA system toxin [Xenorhabdus sp. 12]MDX7989254.1 DUF2829 domain-containing protein [Xenorhabdus sp. 12]